jgi:L-ribulokinase
LHTKAPEVYRALVEATAFGALTIINRLEEYGVRVEEVVNCGGIAEKNPFVMQIYADVCNRPMKISRSAQTCALGAAIFGAVAGGAF